MYGRNFFFIEEAVRLIVPFVLVNDILSSDESKQVKLRLIEKSEERRLFIGTNCVNFANRMPFSLNQGDVMSWG